MNDLLKKLDILIKLLGEFKSFYIDEIKRRDMIINAQKKYIRDLEKFIDDI